MLDTVTESGECAFPRRPDGKKGLDLGLRRVGEPWRRADEGLRRLQRAGSVCSGTQTRSARTSSETSRQWAKRSRTNWRRPSVYWRRVAVPLTAPPWSNRESRTARGISSVGIGSRARGPPTFLGRPAGRAEQGGDDLLDVAPELVSAGAARASGGDNLLDGGVRKAERVEERQRILAEQRRTDGAGTASASALDGCRNLQELPNGTATVTSQAWLDPAHCARLRGSRRGPLPPARAAAGERRVGHGIARCRSPPSSTVTTPGTWRASRDPASPPRSRARAVEERSPDRGPPPTRPFLAPLPQQRGRIRSASWPAREVRAPAPPRRCRAHGSARTTRIFAAACCSSDITGNARSQRSARLS